MSRRHAAPFLFAVALHVAPAAVAQEPSGEVTAQTARSAELAAQAEEAFLDGRFEDAIALLEQAYAADQNPNMLYNIARVHEERGDLEAALSFYRRFVVAADVDIAYRREAQLSAESIEQTLAERTAAQAAKARQAEVARAQEEQALLRPPPFPTTSPMRPLGFALAGVGGATVLGGVAVGLVAMAKQRQFDEAQTLADRRALGASARDLATAADALYISGAVLIVTGVVTAFVSPRRAHEGRVSQQLGVTLRDGEVGAAWSWRF